MAVRKEIVRNMKGMRKLGIPTVIDRTIQQAIAQQLMPIYEPLFAETSYGYSVTIRMDTDLTNLQWMR